ncbi:hypothetical protein ABBQ32_013564 [Trebouxia sp. C0010 RCD-2024]
MRIRQRSGCLKCSMRNRKRKAQPTFAEAQPAEMAQWDFERNEPDGLYPDKVTLGSTKLQGALGLLMLSKKAATPLDSKAIQSHRQRQWLCSLCCQTRLRL